MYRTENQIFQLKMQMVRYMPFYGEVLLRVPVIADSSVSVACTNGKAIYYNPDEFEDRSIGECNYILMHEVLHIIFRHTSRVGTRRHEAWNCAADLVVNYHVDQIMKELPENSVPFERPSDGFFTDTMFGSTENLYERLMQKNRVRFDENPEAKIFTIVLPDYYGSARKVYNDLIPQKQGDVGISHSELTKLVNDAIVRGNGPSIMSSHELLTLADVKNAKKKDWRKILRNYLTEHVCDETSYATPERKYIHMDMIIPGYCLSAERLEEVWAFVDTSGSISAEEMKEFLVQLYTIVRDFRCRLNICYWDTSVNDVYRNLRSKEDVLKSVSYHSGGTNINCVYSWLRTMRIKPGLMLIMTDGMFGRLKEGVFMPNLKSKTILVINNDSQNSDYCRIGTTVRL